MFDRTLHLTRIYQCLDFRVIACVLPIKSMESSLKLLKLVTIQSTSNPKLTSKYLKYSLKYTLTY